ncbi:hypothetical protein Nepgr_030197 [Nepenthes gracilis]|uniref:Uncharacterized protein n=1 Tax=Nepenthes gracilis TaxID=150966 RepID=A0AAD3TFT3_NEPGR|nr:hypothetical protein Nepgr_030197 [Nepenthes gracilis]
MVSSFVTLLQKENPAREFTIVRTAGKLTPFNFNKLPDLDDSKARSASRRHQKKFNLKGDESTPPESFCPLCNSPLDKTDLLSFGGSATGRLPDNIAAYCCSSCRFQILPDDPSAMEHFYSLLPNSISQAKFRSSSNHKWLINQIEGFTLSDTED